MRPHGPAQVQDLKLTGDEKPAGALARADFERCAVWEFSHTVKKEMWVRPATALTALPRGRYSLQVACSVELPGGVTTQGWADVTTVNGCEIAFLMVFGPTNVITVPLDDTAPADRQALATGLEKPADRVFPLRITLRIPLEGESASFSRAVS